MVMSDSTKLTRQDFQALFDECSNWGRWGDDDERGTLNLITAHETRRAARLVREGTTVSCAWPLNTVADEENKSPATHLMIRAGDVQNDTTNRSTSDYLALAPHGVAHSHLDALCHIPWQGKIYNNQPVDQVTSMGALKSAITIGQSGIMSRGVLLDIPLVKGVEWLEPGTPIMPEDLEAAEAAAKLKLESGDILLVRTGRHARRRAVGPWNVAEQLAGLDVRCAPWLKRRGVALLGCDGISDVRPHAVENVGLPIHILTLCAMGMQLLDNLNLDDVAQACAQRSRWEFSLTIAPLRLERGTASAVSPIAAF